MPLDLLTLLLPSCRSKAAVDLPHLLTDVVPGLCYSTRPTPTPGVRVPAYYPI